MPTNPRKIRNVTLEELMALNDEIIALVRAGVPLELGLSELGADRSGVLSRVGSRLAARMSQGESLPEALGHEELGLPRSYRVIVEAGLRAGRLTSALEGVSHVASNMAELRRRIGLALVYPMIVLMFAYGLFVLTCTHLAPYFKFLFDNLGIEVGGLYGLMSDIGRYAAQWWWVFPVVVVGLIFWWRRAGAGGFLSGDGPAAKIACLCPGMKKVARFSRYSQFAELLALLIEHDVPMQQALVLASETTNDDGIQDAARAVADATSRGWTSHLPGHSGFPPFLHWLITRKEEQTGLVSALRAAADMYRRRAVLITEWIKVTFPVLAAVIIGGGATLIYTLSVFYPLTELLKRLAGFS